MVKNGLAYSLRLQTRFLHASLTSAELFEVVEEALPDNSAETKEELPSAEKAGKVEWGPKGSSGVKFRNPEVH